MKVRLDLISGGAPQWSYCVDSDVNFDGSREIFLFEDDSFPVETMEAEDKCDDRSHVLLGCSFFKDPIDYLRGGRYSSDQLKIESKALTLDFVQSNRQYHFGGIERVRCT